MPTPEPADSADPDEYHDALAELPERFALPLPRDWPLTPDDLS